MTRPSSLALLALAGSLFVGGCVGTGTKLIDVVTPSWGYVIAADVPYGAGPRRTLDVYRPKALAAGAQAPVVVFFYGGSWREGSKAQFRFVAQALTARGIVVVVPDYRVFPEVSYPDFLDDSAAAVAWTLGHVGAYGGDAKRVFVTGHSAGAYNAAMVAYDPRWLARYGVEPSRLRGFVGLAGPYNFLPIVDPGVREVFHWPATPPDSQPINHVGRGSLPARLIAARHDTFVYPEQNTEPMAAKLRANGVEVRTDIHGVVNHVTLIAAMAWPLRFLAPIDDEFVDFVLTH